MRIEPFSIERWFGRYEFTARYNIAASSIEPFTLAELEEICGAEALRGDAPVSLGYTDSRGIPELRQEIAKMYPGRGSENVLVTTGAIEANFLVFAALLEPGDIVISEFPAYQQLYEVPRSQGADVKLWRLDEAQGFRPDISELEALVAQGAKMIVINHPHNPTGAPIDAGSMAAVCDIAEQLEAVLVSDEVYRGLSLSDSVASPSAQRFSDSAVSIGSMSKAYGLPGLRIGWIVGPEEIIEKCSILRDYTSICPAGPSQLLALAALRSADKVLARSRSIARRNLSTLNEWLRENSGLVRCVLPREGVVVFVRYAADAPSLEIAEELVKEDGVLVVPGSCFEMEGYLRIGFGGNASVLETGLDLLSKKLASLT
ncbi:MAG: aminotransferase class I/II-fold pyridoxal phosphate-dependent enzyme [Firmicutes bacterium]|jgi:aspartate/methionine/tyrosine aminotransferase|nr:aminotransferase class I/II-fold pyridoxal phosphate-dependent enzyme [Bacillota bacterium]MDH7495834.1 aminotransferase class I/II-fold pyridoxal phosphate-dependent enzyme [Bacillota bacterium]